MSSYTLTHSIAQKGLILPRLPRINVRMFWVLSLALIVFLLIFYIFQINKITSSSYLIGNYESKIAGFSDKNEVLEISFSKNGSLESLRNEVGGLSFERVEKIHYLRVVEGAVAVK